MCVYGDLDCKQMDVWLPQAYHQHSACFPPLQVGLDTVQTFDVSGVGPVPPGSTALSAHTEGATCVEEIEEDGRDDQQQRAYDDSQGAAGGRTQGAVMLRQKGAASAAGWAERGGGDGVEEREGGGGGGAGGRAGVKRVVGGEGWAGTGVYEEGLGEERGEGRAGGGVGMLSQGGDSKQRGSKKGKSNSSALEQSRAVMARYDYMCVGIVIFFSRPINGGNKFCEEQ